MSDDSIGDIEIMINRLVDGELDPIERQALERQLLRDPEAHAMLRACGALDDQCRDAIASALAPAPAAGQSRRGRSWAFAAAAAAAVVLGVVSWSIFIPRPEPSGGIAGNIDNPTPTTMRNVKLVVDRFDPAPPEQMMIRPVRHVDRIPVGLFDAESGQLKIILVDREQEQRESQWLDL
ncbi:MAG: hypothetical protein QGH60_21045 [Phycisphaerae bacterium]|jgi:anti-sigma factor RsiW|nr:hypothetical protein [Phycisphaerae bacterium]